MVVSTTALLAGTGVASAQILFHSPPDPGALALADEVRQFVSFGASEMANGVTTIRTTRSVEPYDMGRLERRLNAFPQFRTSIDGLGIRFLHVRSWRANALPIILTHGWPG